MQLWKHLYLCVYIYLYIYTYIYTHIYSLDQCVKYPSIFGWGPVVNNSTVFYRCNIYIMYICILFRTLVSMSSLVLLVLLYTVVVFSQKFLGRFSLKRCFKKCITIFDFRRRHNHDLVILLENKNQNSPSIRPFVFVCGCVFSVFCCRCCCCFCLSFHPVPLTLPLRLQGRWLVTTRDWSSTTLKLGLWPSAALFPASHPASSATCRALGTLHPGQLVILHCL